MDDRLRAAVIEWTSRQRGEAFPEGETIQTPESPRGWTPIPSVARFVPSASERAACCPSRGQYADRGEVFALQGDGRPPDYLHCLTLTHVATKHGVSRIALMRALKTHLEEREEENAGGSV